MQIMDYPHNVATTPLEQLRQVRLNLFSAWLQNIHGAHLVLEKESVRILKLHMMFTCTFIPPIYLHLIYMVRQYCLSHARDLKERLQYNWQMESAYLTNNINNMQCNSLKSMVEKILAQNCKIQCILFATEILFSHLQDHVKAK